MKGRPAETATAVTMIGALIAYVHGVRDPQTLASITAGVGLVPAVVTLYVDAGGLKGILGKLWRGRTPAA